jgi:deoxyribonuclease IV
MERIGFHVSAAGGVSNAFSNAQEIGCTAMQIFLSSPRSWEIVPIGKEETKRFIEKENSSGITPVVVHMPYLPNLASPKADIYKKSVGTLKEIAKSCSTLEIDYVVMHMGSHMGEGREKGMANIVAAVNSALNVSEDVCLLLEDQSGQANNVGSKMEDLGEMYRELSNRNVGLCLDTCHLWGAGYDIGDHEVLKRIDREVGFKNVKVIHLNDSKFGLGLGKDRHEQIGLGEIGSKRIKSFLSYNGVRGIPLIMETPHESTESQIKELALVKKLMK